MSYNLTGKQKEDIKRLYLKGLSSYEIKEVLKLPHSPRSIQRNIKKVGIIRDRSEAFKLAIKRGRMKYYIKPNKVKRNRLPTRIRYQVLDRDNNKCVICGNTAKEARLQVDHIDENKNNQNPDNLQTLCELCNKGKFWSFDD